MWYLYLSEPPLHYPDLAARVHSRSPERFLTAVAEMIKQGCGFPKLLNDDEIIPLHLAKGAPLEDIYDYAASGCAEIRMPRVDTYTSGHAQMNFGAAVELVLYNGRMKKYGDELLTVETGDVRNFTTWEEFWQAYATQQNYLMRHAFMQQYHIIKQGSHYLDIYGNGHNIHRPMSWESSVQNILKDSGDEFVLIYDPEAEKWWCQYFLPSTY